MSKVTKIVLDGRDFFMENERFPFGFNLAIIYKIKVIINKINIHCFLAINSFY